MKIDRVNFKKEEKKLKKHYNELFMLNKIILHIKECHTYEELSKHPVSIMYGFESLKEDMNGYYSFNLCKNGGTIRLIVSIDKENKIVKLEYITMKHYEDIKRKWK